MPKRRRYLTRAELTAEISARQDLTFERIDQVLDALAELGVDLDALVKGVVDEPFSQGMTNAIIDDTSGWSGV